MVGTGRFELPTPRTPSECSTRLSHVPTRKESTEAAAAIRQLASPQRRGSPSNSTLRSGRKTCLVILSAFFARRIYAIPPQRLTASKLQRSFTHNDIQFRPPPLLQISPIHSHAHIHLQRHNQRMRFLHVLPHQRLHGLDFALGNFKHQLVVHLQRHSRFHSALA